MSVILVALAIVAGLMGQYFAHEELEKQLDHRIAAESSLLIAEYERAGLAALMVAVSDRHERHESSGLGYLLVNHSGRRLAGSLQAEAPTEAGWREFLYVDHDKRKERSAYQALTSILPSGERLVVGANRTPIDEIDSVIVAITASNTAAMLLMGIGGAWIIGLITRRRIDSINDVASAITDGDITRRIPQEDRAGEFDRLAENLNRMLDRNSDLLANLNQVSTDIAHDLRTPLNRQQQLLELALSEGRTAQDYRSAIESAIAAGLEIQQLFSALLKISEIESLTLRDSFTPVSLTETAEKVRQAFQPDVEESGKALIVSFDPDVFIQGDHHLLSQLLVNLLENAMRHTPGGTTIKIGLHHYGESTDLIVEDDGPGVPILERSRITERFVRLESSRSTPGNGLGLSLVKAIAAVHGATLYVEDNEPGLRIRITFATAQRISDI